MEEIVARMASRDIILFDGQNMTGCLDHVRTYARTYAHTNMHTHADTHTSTPDLSRSGSLSYYKHTPDHTHTHTRSHTQTACTHQIRVGIGVAREAAGLVAA